MSDLAQELRGVSLFLQRVTIIGRAHDLDGIGDHLPALSFALRCDERAAHHDGSASDEMLHRGVIRQGVFRDDLQVPQAGAVVQFEEGKILRIAPGAHPSLDQHPLDRPGAVQSVPDGSGREHGRKFAGRSRSYKGKDRRMLGRGSLPILCANGDASGRRAERQVVAQHFGDAIHHVIELE